MLVCHLALILCSEFNIQASGHITVYIEITTLQLYLNDSLGLRVSKIIITAIIYKAIVEVMSAN